MKYIVNILTTCILLTILCACDGRMFYQYAISNKSSSNLFLEVYPDGKIDDDPEYVGYWGGYEPSAHNARECVDYLFEIYPTGSMKFTYISECPAIFHNSDKSHENTCGHPLWLQHNCVRKLYFKNESDCIIEIPIEYWSDSSNWIRQKVSWDFIVYTLEIDNEVIRQYGVVTN